MAVTKVKGELSTPIARVHDDVQNVASTTSQTLIVLRAILGDELQRDCQDETPSSRQILKPAKSIRPGTRALPTNHTSKSKADQKLSSSRTTSVPELSERRRLATETFNATLKNLSDAAKSKSEQQKLLLGTRSPLKPLTNALTIQESSQNRKGPANKNKLELCPAENLIATTECALAALNFLAVVNRRENAKHEQNHNLEAGVLALLDKTITLELVSQAQDQIYYLSTRLRCGPQNSGVDKQVLLSSKQALLLCLKHDKLDNYETRFKFVTSLQSQTLRFIILKGSSVIDASFLEAIDPETVGSPARTIIDSVTAAYLSADSAAAQLRVISQALSKIYSSVVDEGCQIQSVRDSALTLSVIALKVKCESWKLLKHTPDLEKDLWSHVIRYIQRYLVASKRSKSALLHAKTGVQQLQAVLRRLNFDPAPPKALLIVLPNASELSLDARGEKIEDQFTRLSLTDRSGKASSMALTCRVTADKIAAYPVVDNEVLELGFNAAALLKTNTSKFEGWSNEVLLAVIQLRKSATTTIEQIGRIGDGRVQDSFHFQLQACCLRINYAILEYLSRLLFYNRSEKTGPLQQADTLVLALAKTIEAVIGTAKLSTQKLHSMSDELVTALRLAITFRNNVLGGEGFDMVKHDTAIYLKNLPTRISQVLWNCFLIAQGQGQATEMCLNLLKQATTSLEGLPFTDQQAAFLGVKHERLASCYIDLKRYPEAVSSLRAAISFSIKQGCLTDAVGLAQNQVKGQIWHSDQTHINSLGELLSNYARLHLDEDLASTTTTWYFDDATLPDFHRCILLERQVNVALSSVSMKSDKNLLCEPVKLMLELSTAARYRACQLRILSQTLFIVSKSRLLDAGDFVDQSTQELIDNNDEIMEHVFLSDTLPYLRATTKSQSLFITGGMNEQHLLTILKALESANSRCDDTSSNGVAICDATIYMSQLKALIDFADVLGISEHQSRLLSLLDSAQHHVQEINVAERIRCLTRKGQISLELQDINLAGQAFNDAKKLLHAEGVDSTVRLEWHIAHATYLFNTTNAQSALLSLRTAQQLFEATLLDSATTSSATRFRIETILAEVYGLAARISLQNGHLIEANIYGRHALKLSTILWLAIEKNVAEFASSSYCEDDSRVHEVAADLSNLTLLSTCSQNMWSIRGAKYWTQIACHRRALRYMALLSAHNGSYQDALYFLQQAYKLTVKTSSARTCDVIHSDLALLHANAGSSESAQAVLANLHLRTGIIRPNFHDCEMLLNMCEAWLQLSQFEHVATLLKVGSAYFGPNSAMNAAEHDKLITISGSEKAKTRGGTSKITRSRKNVHAGNAALPVPNENSSVSQPFTGPNLKHDVFRTRFLALLDRFSTRHIDGDHAISFDNHEESAALIQDALLMVTKALRKLHEAYESFSSDPTNCVLAETAMALPVRYKSARKSGRLSFMHNASPVDRRKKRQQPPTSSVDTTTEVSAFEASEPSALSEALSLLSNINKSHLPSLSTSTVDIMHKALSQIVLLSSATSQSARYSSSDVVLQALTSKDIAATREQHTIDAESSNLDRRDLQSWPKIEIEASDVTNDPWTAYDLKSFTSSLPPSWSIASVGLNHNETELTLTKLTCNRSPFLMRVPLTRGDMEDDTDGLTLSTAKAELMTIITEANLSAHDVRGQGDKAARKAWYSDREALDKRLELLLYNIENIWLGGFRGVLSSQTVDDGLLARFGQSLKQILDKHLPSRQKTVKGLKDKIELHAHVLELFTTIPFAVDDTEFEDSVNDLLYFVVDILQFNGEANAYDEIDFDIILVEVIDALRGYHDASARNVQQSPRHTILIIDKELQSFPWESIPCLRNHSVSRMPSLSAIKRRLDLMHAQKLDSHTYTIPTNTGAYILNPSSDLTSTQETFSPILTSQLSKFTPLVNHAPTETEFESLLHDNPLLLYFGHGSGAQYIRGRVIRKMDKCAVTLLMGCSSAKMTECGIYESYGMPRHYMNAGSPAVVGTLWDVTDRDIDRFAMKVLCEWGLIDEDAAEVEKVFAKSNNKKKSGVAAAAGGGSKEKKKAGKQRADAAAAEVSADIESESRMTNTKRGVVALDAAVSKARDSCLLRYLNGAAPVIYGIPVTLS